MRLPPELDPAAYSARLPHPARRGLGRVQSAESMRSIRRMTFLAALLVLVLATATLLSSVTASAAGLRVITGVTFTGTSSPPGPTVSVTGKNFGLNPPTGYNNNNTSCGPYTNNGDDYGKKFYFVDKTRNWAAGVGIPPNGNCIGIIVLSWKPNKVFFMFGNAYGSFDDWFAVEGDSFTLTLKGAVFTGTVHYAAIPNVV